MAKPSTVLIKLVSTAGTGYFYTTKKNPRSTTEKLNLKKYDPRARKHIKSRKPRSNSAGPARGSLGAVGRPADSRACLRLGCSI